MKILIGDIGNTLTKLCLINERAVIIREYNIETAKIIKEKNLIKFLKPILNKNIKKKILFSSVVPKAYQKINRFFTAKKYQVYEIKKPNDLLIDEKKICGILQEVIEHKKEKYLITGIGINTKILPTNKDFKSTSLKINSNKNINNKIIIDTIKKNYDKLVFDINNQNSLYVKKKYK